MNQHIVALLMLFSNMTHAKAPDTVPVAREPARAAHERKVEAYQGCLAAARAAQSRKVRGRESRPADCVDPGPYIALSNPTPAGPAASVAPVAPAADKARLATARTASKS